ncbi:MAG: AAA family ATPase, partial [Treponema sp.]|nr:AAA family ATPase [Treponema sp.]
MEKKPNPQPTGMKLPVGISNFEELITEGYLYVDKTRYIELLENESNPYQLFIRPRKFGKSLFFTTLSCYYDRNYTDRFDTLFKQLYIGAHPTPKHNSFVMLKFDFSGLNTASAEKFEVSFYDKIRESLIECIKTYCPLFPDAESEIKRISQTAQSTGALQTVFTAVAIAKAKLFVIIDEYDHFANDLIALGKLGDDVYHQMVNANGLVRDFYETLKIGTKSVVTRIFLTGISPMMMNDLTSGFNIASNLTLTQRYNEMMGFTSEEVDTLIDTALIDRTLITRENIDLERYYNGYLFNKKAKQRVYNPTMALYCLSQIQIEQSPPEQLFDNNVRTDYARLRSLAQNDQNRKTLIKIMKEDAITAEIQSSFSIDEMYHEKYFVSLLFY